MIDEFSEEIMNDCEEGFIEIPFILDFIEKNKNNYWILHKNRSWDYYSSDHIVYDPNLDKKFDNNELFCFSHDDDFDFWRSDEMSDSGDIEHFNKISSKTLMPLYLKEVSSIKR